MTPRAAGPLASPHSCVCVSVPTPVCACARERGRKSELEPGAPHHAAGKSSRQEEQSDARRLTREDRYTAQEALAATQICLTTRCMPSLAIVAQGVPRAY